MNQNVNVSGKESVRSGLRQSLISPKKDDQNCLIRFLTTIDVFSFLPVPKTQVVSTRQSLCGTFLFLALFLTYVIYDFVKFAKYNPPIPNQYYQQLSTATYTYPNVAITFMYGLELDNPIDTSAYFDITMKSNLKYRGGSGSVPIELVPCTDLSWIDQQTLKFYSNLKCPKAGSKMDVSGLIYASNNTINPAIKIAQCNVNRPDCNRDQVPNITAGGRIFLFIQKQTSKYDVSASPGSNFLIYNFFLVPMAYNRINVLSQVNVERVMPDYFNRYSENQQTRIEVEYVTQFNSDVKFNGPDASALLMSIQFTLDPNIRVTKYVYNTLIDRIANWGALSGVLLSVFALIFLTYNKRKFYKKNPKWDNFDENLQMQQRDGDNSQIISTR